MRTCCPYTEACCTAALFLVQEAPAVQILHAGSHLRLYERAASKVLLVWLPMESGTT